jgi:hypothetical protein
LVLVLVSVLFLVLVLCLPSYIYIYIYISYIKCNNVTLYERILTCFIIYRNAILTFLTHPLLTHLPPPLPGLGGGVGGREEGKNRWGRETVGGRWRE